MWHGTHPRYIRTIATLGFRREFTKRHVYGLGVYFAADAAYSAHADYAKPDDQGVRRVLLCRVACGVPSIGRQSYVSPMYRTPAGDIKTCDVYVDKHPPSIVSCPADDQAYPEFLVTFYDMKQHRERNYKGPSDIEKFLYL